MKVLLLLLFIYLIFPVRIQNSQLAILPIICLFSWHCFLILPFLPPSLSQCGFLLSRTPGHAQVNIPGAKNVRSGISSNRELSRHLLNAMNTSRLNIRCIYIALMGLVPIDKAELLKKKSIAACQERKYQTWATPCQNAQKLAVEVQINGTTIGKPKKPATEKNNEWCARKHFFVLRSQSSFPDTSLQKSHP